MQAIFDKKKLLNESFLLLSLFLINFLIFIVTLSVFYILGPESFPDYDGYILLATFPDWSGASHLTEFISRFILESQFFGFSPKQRVDFFIIFVQLTIFIFFLFAVLSNPRNLYSITVGNAFYLPFFLTTGLRAAPLYYFFFLFCVSKTGKEINIANIILISLVGSLFHDSFLALTVLLLFSYTIFKLKLSKQILIIFLLIGMPIVFVDNVGFIANIIEIINFDLGRLLFYLDLNQYSLSKALYLFVILIMCLYYVSFRDFSYSTYVIFSFAIIIIISSLFNYVVAIRISIFTLLALFAFSSSLIFRFENRISNYILFTIPVCAFLYIFQLMLLIN